jgi:glutathione S-transferase-like protein
VGSRGALDRFPVSSRRNEALHLLGNISVAEAGHDPEVIKSYGLAILPGPFNATEGRREAKRLTGKYTVPVLVTDDGEVVADSKNIVAWAEQHPAA